MSNTICGCNRVQSPIITVTPALGSSTSPYLLEVQINQQLCYQACQDATPVFIPQFNVLSVANVGTNTYAATVQVQGAISYVKCGGGCCDTKMQPISATFTIPFTATIAPTSVTIAKDNTVNAVDAPACRVCGKQFVSDNFVTLTIV